MSGNKSFTLIEPCLPCLPAGRRQGRSSFTLIELLIVIGILAVLVAAIVVVLNPAQLLAQARDGKRQQDLLALTQALNTIYALDQSVSFGSSSVVYTSLPDSTTTCANWNLPTLPSGWNYHCVSTSTLQNTNGTGWIPVNFTTTGVVSLASLPVDPVNTSSTGLYYTYVSGGSFELSALMESTKYRSQQIMQASQNNAVSGAYLVLGSNVTINPILSPQGLTSWWKLDGDAGDVMGTYSNTIHGGVTFASHGAGSAARFDGTSGYISSSGATLSSPISISLWAYIPQAGVGTSTFFSSGHDMFKFGFLSNGDACVDSACGTDTGYNIAIGQWYHLVTTYDGTNESLYANGAPVYTHVATIGPHGTPYLGATVYLTQFFNGFLDDLRVYNRALSASEIQALYNATK